LTFTPVSVEVASATDERIWNIWCRLFRAEPRNRATAQPRNRAIVQEILLPPIRLLPPLPGIAQRFFTLHQSSQEFIQPLRGLIRRLMEFIQSPKAANQPLVGFHQSLLGFIQRFFGLNQSLREANQSLPDA
jgi:hypothetical protein